MFWGGGCLQGLRLQFFFGGGVRYIIVSSIAFLMVDDAQSVGGHVTVNIL